MSERVSQLVRELIAALLMDENYSGGLLSRETLRKACELQVLLAEEPGQ